MAVTGGDTAGSRVESIALTGLPALIKAAKAQGRAILGTFHDTAARACDRQIDVRAFAPATGPVA